MALLKNSFITDEVENISFEPLPAGNYEAQIIDSDIRTTKDGTGEYIALTWEILTPEYTGRRVFDNLNIVNKNEKAVAIAKSRLKQICEAIEMNEMQDTQELHGQPMRVALGIRPAQGGYDAQNNIKKVMSIDVIESNPFIG